jgi:hypothetical protein
VERAGGRVWSAGEETQEWFKVRLTLSSSVSVDQLRDKARVFINKTSSTETAYQQDLINRDLVSARFDSW